MTDQALIKHFRAAMLAANREERKEMKKRFFSLMYGFNPSQCEKADKLLVTAFAYTRGHPTCSLSIVSQLVNQLCGVGEARAVSTVDHDSLVKSFLKGSYR